MCTNDTQVHRAFATLGAKEGVYDETSVEMDPHGDPMYKAAFETDQGTVILWVNSFEYYALHVGQQGELCWKGDSLISFGDVIRKNFNMNN